MKKLTLIVAAMALFAGACESKSGNNNQMQNNSEESCSTDSDSECCKAGKVQLSQEGKTASLETAR